MPKRKRSSGSSLQVLLYKHQDELFRALKASKGFERQRLSKKLRDPGVTADKAKRLQREIAVLKSLDLRETARVHLSISLTRIPSIAALTHLPDELRHEVTKPDLPEDRTALHNVTSGLYSREPVKKVILQAIESVCTALNVAFSETPTRGQKNGRREPEEPPADRMQGASANSASSAGHDGADSDDESEFQGFGSDRGSPASITAGGDGNAELHEESHYDKLDELLGSSSSEDEWNGEEYAHIRGQETANLDDISLSDFGDEQQAGPASSAPSDSPSPPPAKTQTRQKRPAVASTKSGRLGESAFLPSLMGGYISGSESASDIEDAKPKKRRGQRARRLIWEKKYGSSARHLQQPAQSDNGRDSGWDMRRGAVDGENQGKRTARFGGPGHGPARRGHGLARGHMEGAPAPKVAKRDDQGSLHPSWAARKKAKESQKPVAFAGQKVVFD